MIPQKLSEFAPEVLIVAHQEDTSELQEALEAEGFSVDIVRGPYTRLQLQYSAIMRCLVNHSNAWRIAASRNIPTIIIEADFVPVKGMGSLPTPIPVDRTQNYISYLYSVGPEIWDLTNPYVARGHGGGMVALLIPPNVASLLLDFFEEEASNTPTGDYNPFDTKVGYWLLKRGIQSYIPYRHYGEHGGIGNPEHALAGLGRPHRADALQEELHFLPFYARDSRTRFLAWRLWARSWGLFRLFTGRFLRLHDFKRAQKFKMIRFALGRLITKRLPTT